MATSFDATARINLDIRSFAQGAQAVTKSGGQMSQIFQNLNQAISKVALVEGQLAAKLRTSLQIYSQATSTVKNYASAVAALQKNEAQGANGAKLMTSAFLQLRAALSQVQGVSEKEYQRLSRSLALYERMAKAIQQLASAQKSMSSVTQNAISSQQKDEQAKRKSAETAQRLSIEEQKLALRREQLAQSSARIAADEARIAAGRQRLAQATSEASKSNISMSASSFAVRSALGELEQSFQQLFNVVSKVPAAFASAAISQEAAFAQVSRVVTESAAASAGLLQRFQEIAQQAPISFEEVARIGQLGGQIGISASALGDFTNTVVKFSLTTGVASEEATLLLGRIAQMQQVPISEMEQLGSAILALGTASAATEQEILRINASIATVSNLFGLTTQETAGLSAALATLNVRPELARGALTRVFNDLSIAVSDGGAQLEKLGKVMGMTGAETAKLFKQDPGAFFLTFVQGLSRAAGAGGEVQGVLRELGVNAVRDIDVFSRLANNTDVVRESFDMANVEFARGTELQRQSQGIYKTTSAELQNMGDAFKTLLATLGGPLAQSIGFFAKSVGNVAEFLAHLGPIVPIFGSLAAVVTAGGAAWLIYQVALSKTIQSLIAAKELQNNLGVSSLGLSTAIKVYRDTLTSTTTAQKVSNVATRELAISTEGLAVSLAGTSAGIRAYAASAASSAAGLNAMSTANVMASRTAQTMFKASATQQGALRQLNAAGVATAVSMTGVSQSNRALAMTQGQLANASRVSASQTMLAVGSMQGLNTSTVRTVPVMATMSNSMQRAATAGAQLGSGLGGATGAGQVAAKAFTGTAEATAKTGFAARAAAAAFGPWGIAIATAGLVLGPMIGQMLDFRSQAEKISDAAMTATGGTQALANAIKADTDAAVQAAGGMQKYNDLVRSGSKEALDSIGVFRTATVAKDDLSAADVRAAERARAKAKEENRAIERTKGQVDELKAQAQGHGAGAEAAARYLRAIAANNATVEKSTKVLGENTVAIGANVQQWLADTAQQVVQTSKLADGSKTSADALDMMAEAGVNVGDVLNKSLSNPKGALNDLDAAIKEVSKTADNYAPTGSGKYAETINNEAAAASKLKDFLVALRTVVASESDESTKSAVVKKLLGDALDKTGSSAASASGKIKLTKESLEDLDTTGEEAQQAIDQLASSFEKFGTPLDAFKSAAKSAFGDAKDAMDKFSLSSKGGLDAYIKELEKIAKAQREWAANLIKISTTLGPDVAEQFRKMGPEAAPAVAELADLSAAELSKLGPRLREIGAGATSDLAAAIIQNSGKIKNATLQTKTVIADVFGNLVDKAKTSQDFADVSNGYAKLVTQLGKLKGVKIDISADDAKAFKSLNDLSLYIDLVGNKIVKPKVALDIIKAQGDIKKLQEIIAAAEASGSLDAEGKAKLDDILFKAQLGELGKSVGDLSAGGKFDPKGKGKLSDSEYRAKVLALTQFLASTEGQGLLNPKGKSQLKNEEYIAKMQGLATLILGKEQAGEFDVNGDGKLNPDEFKALLEALKRAVRDANNGKLDAKGHATLANTEGFRRQLGGIVQAAYTAGGRIQQALTRSATVSVGYSYHQNNKPPRVGAAATGGWINGPGGPKSDVIPMMLSNKEFVVNAASAKRYGALLEVINRQGGRGFSGIAKLLADTGVTGGSQPVKVAASGGNSMLGQNMVQQVPPESVSVLASKMTMPQMGPTTVFNINNQYPQSEPTSVTINRSLAYAATISGV